MEGVCDSVAFLIIFDPVEGKFLARSSTDSSVVGKGHTIDACLEDIESKICSRAQNEAKENLEIMPEIVSKLA